MNTDDIKHTQYMSKFRLKYHVFDDDVITNTTGVVVYYKVAGDHKKC